MGSNINLKNRAIALRKEGKSYGEILKILDIKSKGTLSLWFKNITLSAKSKALLKKNSDLAHVRGLEKSNIERAKRIQEENHKSYIDGHGMIDNIPDNILTIIGASLYWGEGTKSEKRLQKTLSFSNSDPEMVVVYMKFIRKILKVPEEKIRAGIHVYASTSIDGARAFWSKITGLPTNRFYIVTQISRASQGKRPINLLPHGTIAIKVNNRLLFFRVKGMIRGIIDTLQ